MVPVEHYRQLSLGMTARVHPETSSDQGFSATVSNIAKVADAASGTIGVELTLANPDYEILAGVKCVMQFDPPAPTRMTQVSP